MCFSVFYERNKCWSLLVLDGHICIMKCCSKFTSSLAHTLFIFSCVIIRPERMRKGSISNVRFGCWCSTDQLLLKELSTYLGLLRTKLSYEEVDCTSALQGVCQWYIASVFNPAVSNILNYFIILCTGRARSTGSSSSACMGLWAWVLCSVSFLRINSGHGQTCTGQESLCDLFCVPWASLTGGNPKLRSVAPLPFTKSKVSICLYWSNHSVRKRPFTEQEFGTLIGNKNNK